MAAEDPGIPDLPRPGDWGTPNETSQPEVAIRDLPTSEGFGAKGFAYGGKEDGKKGRPGYGDISAPVRFGLVATAVAGIAVIDMHPDPIPVIFGRHFLERLGVSSHCKIVHCRGLANRK